MKSLAVYALCAATGIAGSIWGRDLYEAVRGKFLQPETQVVYKEKEAIEGITRIEFYISDGSRYEIRTDKPLDITRQPADRSNDNLEIRLNTNVPVARQP